MESFVTGFVGDGEREFIEFVIVMGVMVSVVIGWTAWYLCQD